MTSNQNGRLGALAGIGFLALAILGTIVQAGEPGFAAKPEELASWFADDADAILAGSSLYLVAGILLLWFVSALRTRMQRATDGDETLPALAYAGGVAGATLCIAAASVDAMGALRADERGAIDPSVAASLADVAAILYGLAAPAAFAALVLAVAVTALRGAFLPRWVGYVSIPLGLALAIPPISYVAVIVFSLWPALVGALLAFGPQAAHAQVTAPRPAAA
ncbi:MAG TPA: hypothetical protein VGW10_18305 [Solirubrobacteraceae bacterium]|nr:hypothetical protein [Solirubrobacteraceae bacterium]